jgi:hypothetical protein
MITINNDVLEFRGTYNEYLSWSKKVEKDFKTVRRTYEHYYDGPNYVRCCHVTVKCTPYAPDEENERMMYGDPEHEAYLLSDDYEADCKSEQFDWIKNEMG